MTQLGERMLAGAVMCLALEVWMTDTVDAGIQLYTAASIVGLLLAALGRWRKSREDSGSPTAL